MSPLLLSFCLSFFSARRALCPKLAVSCRQSYGPAKNNAEDGALHGALDWACGQGRANCGPIQQVGPCYEPSNIQKMASYAFNNYFLKHRLTDDACYFSNTAALTSLNPSQGDCKFPSSKTVSNASISDPAGMSPESADFSGCDDTYHPLPLLLIMGHFVLVILQIIGPYTR